MTRIPADAFDDFEPVDIPGKIDWLAVDMVVQGTRIHGLRTDERRMIIRRLDHRIMRKADVPWITRSKFTKITVEDVAELLGNAPRHAQRLRDELPAAKHQTCPVCREPMWVITETSTVEAHGDRYHRQCPASGLPLADIYRQVVSA